LIEEAGSHKILGLHQPFFINDPMYYHNMPNQCRLGMVIKISLICCNIIPFVSNQAYSGLRFSEMIHVRQRKPLLPKEPSSLHRSCSWALTDHMVYLYQQVGDLHDEIKKVIPIFSLTFDDKLQLSTALTMMREL
jgi:hypothetical protein